MAKVFVWALLLGVFLLSGYGLNLIRIALVDKLADPGTVIWWRVLIGGVLMTGGIAFLGGLVFYRDKKRNKIKRPDWKSK
ncbi:DUF2627 family protein [Tumebacillus sp. DT12]|uniref:DUF2627 family protein n=1 Tax=Tumebacillus lacus TaxID=2995335 RepID=A0ABT3X0N6_9BACL|nr:DUF2627 family protein [Tumebacillus lacus]MCX7569166.1 DUF2627 family protein [Tumebacillus lacus]